ncbi:hypothetical protein ES703_46829 [subsurface metagenome]
MAIEREIWTDYIAENRYMNNEFLNNCVIQDSNVNYKTVNLSSAGTAAGITRNRTVLPAAVTQRTDLPISYDIDEFTIDPVHIPNAEEVELAYDKLNSVMYDTTRGLNDEVGDWMLYNWRVTSSSYQIRTTGGSASAHLTGATGNRKKLLAADIQTAARDLYHAKGTDPERYLLLDAYMYDQLLMDLRFGEFRDTIKEADLARGIIGNLHGFLIMRRHTVLDYTNASTPVPREPGAAALTSANAAGVCWEKSAVERAFGDIKFFENLDDAGYYGSYYSGLIRAGGRKRRYDGKGVVAIIQTAV